MVTDPNDLMPQLGVEAELTSRGLPNPATFSKDDLDEIIKIYEDDGSFDPTSDFARGLANYASSLYPEDPEWLSYEGLLTGRAGITKAFNDGNPLSVQGVIELLAQDTEGNRIVAPTLYGSETAGGIYQGVKDELIPAAGEAGGFAFGFKTVNDYFNKIKYEGSGKGWNKFLTRVGLPVIAGITTGVVGRNVAEKGQEFILGADMPILPQQRAAYAIGKGGTEGAYFSAMPYFMNKKISLGYELIKDNLITNRLNPLQKKAFEGSGLHTRGSRAALKAIDGLIAGMPTSVSKAPFMYGATEVGANIGTGLAQGSFVEDPDPYIGQLGTEMVYTFTGGYLGDLALRRGPTIANALKEGGIAATKYVTSKDYRAQVRGLNKRALEGQVGAFLYKSLIEAGEDPEAVIKALTSKEFADLLDSDGSPVKPTAGTMSLSPTLLGIEGALQYLTTGLGAQRSANEDAVKEAIRNKIRGLYATGNRDALQESAAMMQGLFEASINKRVNEAVTNLDAAVQKIQTGPDGLPVPASRLEAEKLFDLLDKLMSADRDRERKLWQRIPRDVEISTFLDGQGNEIAVPNFISFWRGETKSTREANVTTMKNFGDTINAFVERKTKELGIGEDVTSTAAPSKELQAANEKFNKLWTRVVSSETGRAEFETLLTQVQNLSPAEQATAFNVRAQEKGGKFSGKGGKAWAEAARAYADVITVQNALNTPPVAEASQVVSEAVQSAQESFARNTQRFNAYLDNPNFSIQSEARDNLRAVQAVARRVENLDDPDEIQRVVDDWVNANAESRTQRYVQSDPQGRGGEFLPDSEFTTDARGFLDSAAALRRAQLENPAAAPEAAAEVATATADVGTLSSAELFDMRSTALADGRELAAQGKMDQARLAFGFADALLKDLESFPEGVNYNYDVARAYSKSFNDAYTRSFVSELLGTDKTGRQRIAPEMLKREFQNLDAAYLNTKQLDDIGQFQQQELLGTLIDGSQLEQTLLGAKSPIEGGLGSSDPRVVQLREGFETVINPESNMIDIPKYKNWLETNRELLNSVAPNLYESSKEVLQNGNTIRGTVENVLRNVREQAIDPDTNTITPKSLRLWMNSENNSQMLAAFPALKADLQSFERANVLLNENTKLSAERKRNIQAQTSFYELLRTTGTEKGGTENPTTAINHALSLSNKTPIKSLNALFAPIGMLDAKSKPLGDLTVSDPSRIEGATRDLTTGGSKDSVGYETALQGETSVVKIGPDSEGKLKVEPVTSATGRPVTVDREEALRGFRVSLIESVLGKAGANAGDGAWSATAAYKAMFEPLPNSQNELSVAEWAQSKGVMNAGQLSNMKKFLAEMVKYEQTLMKSSDGANLELMAKELSPGIDMALSIMGSAAGTQARSIFTGGQGGSGDLIVAGRGAEMFRKAGEKLLRQAPLTARTDILAAVLADPEAMADLIRKGKNPEEIESLRTKAVRWFSDLLDPSPSFARLSRPLITSGEEREYEAETEGGPSVLGSAIALAAPNFMSFGRTDSTTPLIDEVKRLATKEERQEAYRQEQLKRANEFLDSRSPQGARPPTTPPAETATSSSLPISSGSSGRTGSSETMQRGQALFPNDPIFRAFKRGGDVKAGIGGLFR